MTIMNSLGLFSDSVPNDVMMSKWANGFNNLSGVNPFLMFSMSSDYHIAGSHMWLSVGLLVCQSLCGYWICRYW